MYNKNCITLNIIIEFVKAYKNAGKCFKHPYIKDEYNGETKAIYSCNYLLNQILRQRLIPDDHYLLSIEAKKLWDRITTKPIAEYYYNAEVKCEFDNVTVDIYKGASKKPEESKVLNKGSKFKFNSVFHEDHVIPISVIIKELTSLSDEQLNYENVNRILNKIYICRMLKKENFSLTNHSKRPSDLEEILRTVYKNIEIVGIE